MTPVPLELPLKASEAAALADLIFQHAEGKPLTDDVRNRLAGRFAPLRLASLTPCFGSLQQDPVHPSTYYIAVDATVSGERPRFLLLHMALASAPSSALFQRAVLIGRMRPGGGREIVVNAIPFGPNDRQSIHTFAEKIDRGFLPRPRGSQPSITIRTRQPETVLPAAFQAFRSVLKSNQMALASIEGTYDAALWAAIRSGWREGFSAGSDPLILSGETENEIGVSLDAARAAVDAASESTKFTVQASAERFPVLEQLYDYILKTKSAQNSWHNFDFELVLGHTSPEELHTALQHLKSRGCPVQLAEVDAGPGAIEELAAAARESNAILSLRWDPSVTEADLIQIGKATYGRLNYKLSEEFDQCEEIPAYLRWLAEHLRG